MSESPSPLTPTQQARIDECTAAIRQQWLLWIDRHMRDMVAEGQVEARRQLIRAWYESAGAQLAIVAHVCGWTIPGPDVHRLLIGLQESARHILDAGQDLWRWPDQGSL
jgi:hypothetical protein